LSGVFEHPRVGTNPFPKDNISAKFEDIRAILEREGLIDPAKVET
jgi:hypothetical protein